MKKDYSVVEQVIESQKASLFNIFSKFYRYLKFLRRNAHPSLDKTLIFREFIEK